ncbi:hypothetical protein [Comamonas testosteroni]|uniref:hypothetical protein n=1 Tax=Comamonas testosteroni TaxID=285 RepID=UPI00068F7F14|nr:hypothetical protein [Comamonas testosteroni]
MPSISDDDLCSGCTKCTYKPGASSSCEHDFPGSPDQDGYIVRCAEFRPQPITMTSEQVQAAIAGHDLKTFKGWMAAARALLADKPFGTALKDQGQFLAIVGSELCSLAGFGDGRTTYELEAGRPVDGCEADDSAWDDERGCWDGVESADENTLTITAPEFVTLAFVEKGMPHAGHILSQAQAKAAHTAMCALNSVGSELNTSMTGAKGASIFVTASLNGLVCVGRGPDGFERYVSYADFAAAYGLNCVTASPVKTQTELVRAAVLAKIAHWDALCALERSYATELTDKQNDAMCDAVEMLAASAKDESAVNDQAAQAVLDAITAAK